MDKVLRDREATHDEDRVNDESVALRFCWHTIGEVGLDAEGKLAFPRAPAGPGVYRLEVDGPEPSVYVGEANDLRRRFSHYRNPGPSQWANQRLRSLLTPVMADGGRCRLSVAAEIAFGVRSQLAELDLRLKAARLLVESSAIVLARHDGRRTVLNLDAAFDRELGGR